MYDLYKFQQSPSTSNLAIAHTTTTVKINNEFKENRSHRIFLCCFTHFHSEEQVSKMNLKTAQNQSAILNAQLN